MIGLAAPHIFLRGPQQHRCTVAVGRSGTALGGLAASSEARSIVEHEPRALVRFRGKPQNWSVCPWTPVGCPKLQGTEPPAPHLLRGARLCFFLSPAVSPALPPKRPHQTAAFQSVCLRQAVLLSRWSWLFLFVCDTRSRRHPSAHSTPSVSCHRRHLALWLLARSLDTPRALVPTEPSPRRCR